MSTVRQFLAKLHPITIRDRLLVAFLLMVVIPAIAFSVVSAWIGIRSGHQHATNQLTSVVVLKEAEITTWSHSIRSDLSSTILGKETTTFIRTLLSSPEDSEDFKHAYGYLYDRFTTVLSGTLRLDEIFVVNLNERVILSTNQENEGSLGVIGSFQGSESYAYFKQALSGETAERLVLTRLRRQEFDVLDIRPVSDASGHVLGILVGRASSDRMSGIMLERAGLGQTGETYLINRNAIMLTTSRYQEGFLAATFTVDTLAGRNAVEHHLNGSGVYSNYRHDQVIGVYRWLPDLGVALIAEEMESEALRGVYETIALNVGVAILAALVAGAIALYLARSISVPLVNLARTAARVSDGELGLATSVSRDDEIGTLAQAFNLMTARLRDLISSLDQQVGERTKLLNRRAAQLEISAQVGREITSILDMEVLLDRVVRLIAERFGYYHVGIYLVMDETNRLVFYAGAGEVPRPRVNEEGAIDIGPGSMNGEVAQSNNAIVANDVSVDSRFLAVQMLPKTRSEMVVPLRIGARVIGTLDVQSVRVDEFTEDDARIIQALGDQIAIAIENARLYTHSRDLAILEERTRLARELHDSVTQSLYSLTLFAEAGSESIISGDLNLARYYQSRIGETAHQALAEMRLLIHELRPLELKVVGLVEALNQRLASVERRTGIEATLVTDGIQSLPPQVEEQLYRIAQEALNNALRHSSGTSVNVQLRTQQGWVEIEVADNGCGFDVETCSQAGGLGLRNMRQRAERLGGELDIRSVPGGGTKVKVRVRHE